MMTYREFLNHTRNSGMEITKLKLTEAIRKAQLKAFECVTADAKFIIVKIPYAQ